MRGNKRYIWIIITLFTFIGISVSIYKLYRDFSELDDAMQPITSSVNLHFEEINQTIYIKTKVWGLLGNHSCIYVTNKENDYPVKDKDIFFENTVLYYKIQYPDSLFIFSPSMSYSEEKIINKKLDKIKIKITEFKASKNKEYDEMYKEMGLQKIETN